VFVIVGGLVEIRDSSGSLLGRLGAGEVFGEMAIIANVPRTATTVAVAPTQLICIPSRSRPRCRARQSFW
jgi:CRP-like cAMP-binding protein